MASKKPKNNPALLLALLALAGVAALWVRMNGSKPGAPARHPHKPTPTAQPVVAAARLALVLDDWGYSARQLPRLKDFHGKLTVAVIPGLGLSKKAAETAHTAGQEVIMHLPVEPLAKMPLAPGTLMVGMSEAEVVRLCEAHAQSVPFMVGLNNHEGSKGSADPALMGAVARWLKGRHGYFLDSVTTPKSQIPEQARLAGIPWARNRVF
ncbi:MAG: divergent polysaccharide deacetylase family protein, partial [candidate division FCPU426 bacterium]